MKFLSTFYLIRKILYSLLKECLLDCTITMNDLNVYNICRCSDLSFFLILGEERICIHIIKITVSAVYQGLEVAVNRVY